MNASQTKEKTASYAAQDETMEAEKSNGKQHHHRHNGASTEKPPSWTVRRLRESDIVPITRMIVEEWGPTGPQPEFSLFPRALLQPLMPAWDSSSIIQLCNYVDHFVLAVIVYLGLSQRWNRRGWLEESDHCVWCLVDEDQSGVAQILGAAEVSYQPLGSGATPLGLPIQLKQMGASINQMVTYVSNVIISQTARGRGCGKHLMGWIEERHQDKCHELYLHVSKESRVATRFYSELGYKIVKDGGDVDDGNRIWTRLWLLLAGLPFVQPRPTVYLRKVITKRVG